MYKQTIKGNKNIEKDEVSPLFKQKPNRKILGTLPYLYAYFVGRSKLDTSKLNRQREQIIKKYAEKISKIDTTVSGKKKRKNLAKVDNLREKRDKKIDKVDIKLKEGNWLMRVVGEPPSFYDTANTNYNVRQIKYYLNSRGYFHHTVVADIDTSEKKVSEIYNITEGEPYKIKSLEYVIKDTAINAIVNANLGDVEVKTGENYEEGELSSERDRINKLLKENGYYDFNTQYILVEIDSTIGNKEMAVRMVIRNPPNKEQHPRYKISKIIFNSDVTRARQEKWDTTFFQGIYYIYKKDNFSKKILNKKIRIHAGEYYTQSKIQLTQRQLAALDMYKFININFDKYEADSLNDTLSTQLIAHIRTSPLQKFQTTEEGGVNVSSAGFVPGPFGSLNFKSRNTFRGFEVFETTLRASIMGQVGIKDPTDVYRTEEYNGDLSLSFPQFFFPTSIRFKMEDYTPRTRFTTGYSLVNRPEYNRGNIRTSMNYIFNPNALTQYNISIIDLNFINSDLSDDFQNYLDSLYKSSGNPLINSFRTSIVTDINGSFTYNNNVAGTNMKSKFFKIYIESGGVLHSLYKRIPKIKEGYDDTNYSLTLFNDSFRTYRYFKINTDLRYYFPINKNSLAIRLNIGFAKPYAGQMELPYEKYFFMGGSNSMRAWATRRLGIITETAPRGKGGNPLFEQPGQIAIENNYEYRFKIIGFFEGAIFADIGNLWNFKDTSRRETEFKFNKFYQQIAVGTGAGLRLNFSFLILRLDLGIKTLDPTSGISKFVFFKKEGISNPRLNIGIGYPF